MMSLVPAFAGYHFISNVVIDSSYSDVDISIRQKKTPDTIKDNAPAFLF